MAAGAPLPDGTAEEAAEATRQAAALTPATPESPLETPTPVVISLPVIDSGATAQPAATDTPAPPAELVTATPLPVAIVEPTATETPPPPTPTIPPPTSTPVVSPTPTTPFALNSMRAVIDRQPAAARVGPGSFYTQTTTLPIGTQVTLLARDSTGEWLYLCCSPTNNAPTWIRSVSARPADNPALPPPLDTLNPNNIRWLTPRGPDANLAPVPVQPPVAAGEFPMFRHDTGNTARVARLPSLPLIQPWGAQAGLAGQAFTSGAVIAGGSVLAASADGHLYAFNTESGSQLWRFNLGEVVRATPLVEGTQIYVVTESGRLVALENQQSAAVQRWQVQVGGQPRGGILPAPGRILLTVQPAAGAQLLILDRSNGATLRSISVGGAQVLAPALSRQTVYVASDLVRAYDLWSGELVWQSNDPTQFTTAPLFLTPGVEAASELYVGDGQGRLFAYDANSGEPLWVAPVGGPANGLAANGSSIFVSGPGFVRAYARVRRPEGQLLWSANVAGNVPGGPIVDDVRVLVATDGGAIQYLDAVTGAVIAANVQAPPLAGPAAAVAPWLFAPGQNAVLFAARESP
jgi:outer membrane protein assembly factor BamB